MYPILCYGEGSLKAAWLDIAETEEITFYLPHGILIPIGSLTALFDWRHKHTSTDLGRLVQTLVAPLLVFAYEFYFLLFTFLIFHFTVLFTFSTAWVGEVLRSLYSHHLGVMLRRSLRVLILNLHSYRSYFHYWISFLFICYQILYFKFVQYVLVFYFSLGDFHFVSPQTGHAAVFAWIPMEPHQ